VSKPCDHDSRPKYEALIGPIRETARALGYAVGVHGTLKRDIDLIACPWVDTAVDARTLAEAIRDVCREHNGGIAHMTPVEQDDPWHLAGCPTKKPHGRLTWSYHLGGGPYIDLSVMPRGHGREWECAGCRCLNSQPVCWQCGSPVPQQMPARREP